MSMSPQEYDTKACIWLYNERDLLLFTSVQTIFTGRINPAHLIFSYQSELLSSFVK